ncbi:MAG TPA: BACON domain-containing carbohydrate-binding protein [Ktedonobacteraceae bacterium]|nr:BACON domain-containing carbohydrate-binding protein [Ktedonobacteraceae bacterium]
METKRCTHCQKLSRADSQVCRRCGHAFSESKEDRQHVSKVPVRTGHFVSRSGVGRSIPPASPHKAGHYSGLHPEDQPYQSAFLPALRPPPTSLQYSSLYREPDVIVLAGMEPAVAPVQQVSTPSKIDHTNAQSTADAPTRIGVPVERAALQRVTPLPIPPLTPEPPARTPGRPRHFMPMLLTVLVLLLLIAGSVSAFLLVNRHTYNPHIIATPNQLRVSDTLQLSGSGFGAYDLITFTHDDAETPILDGSGHAFLAHTDFAGVFNVSIVIPPDWSPGEHTLHANDAAQGVGATTPITIQQPSGAPPQLALAAATLVVGAAGSGVVSNKTVTLINTGGNKLSWQASTDQPWLTVSPNSGTFSGRASVQVTVNRGTLVPLSYTGHVLFTQPGSNNKPLILTVNMSVIAAPTSLTVSSVALNYVASTLQNPTAQTLTLQNSDSHPVDWGSATVTGNGAAWLSVTPGSGHLAPKSSQTITVNVQSQQLAVGAYQGTIYFKGGANPQVTVSLTVIAPGNMIVSPPSLNFASTGQNPATQTVTLQNSGGAPLSWSVTATTADGTHWLTVTPAYGYLYGSAQANVTIAVNAASLKPNSYQGTLNFSYGTTTRQVAVALTVSVPLLPSIKLNANALNFSTIKGNNPAPQLFTITNTGNTTLNWNIVEDQNGITYLPVTPNSGSLLPNASSSVTVSPAVQQANAGIIASTITVEDSNTNPQVPAQNVAADVTVSDIPVLNLSTNSITFNDDSNNTHGLQLVIITDTGSQPLDWQIQHSVNVAWLSISTTSGTVAPGQNIVVDVECDSTSLSPGTYTVTLTVSDTDPGTPVSPQAIAVTLNVT